MSAEELKPFPCPDCDKGYKYKQDLDRHRENEHGIERPKTRKAAGAQSAAGLRGRIRETMLGTAAFIAIRDARIYTAVEATVDEFATAWENVAKQNPTARRYIDALLNGGVWIPALMSTLVMVVTTMAVTDSLPPALHPLGHFCIGQAGLGHLFAPPPTRDDEPPPVPVG